MNHPVPEKITNWILSASKKCLTADQCVKILSYINDLKAEAACYAEPLFPMDYEDIHDVDMFYLERRYTKEMYLAEGAEWPYEEDYISELEPVLIDVSIDNYGTAVITRECDDQLLDNSEYNKTWRAWDREPCEETMKEAPWDD